MIARDVSTADQLARPSSGARQSAPTRSRARVPVAHSGVRGRRGGRPRASAAADLKPDAFLELVF
jgi:hypothetical protein